MMLKKLSLTMMLGGTLLASSCNSSGSSLSRLFSGGGLPGKTVFEEKFDEPNEEALKEKFAAGGEFIPCPINGETVMKVPVSRSRRVSKLIYGTETAGDRFLGACFYLHNTSRNTAPAFSLGLTAPGDIRLTAIPETENMRLAILIGDVVVRDVTFPSMQNSWYQAQLHLEQINEKEVRITARLNISDSDIGREIEYVGPGKLPEGQSCLWIHTSAVNETYIDNIRINR